MKSWPKALGMIAGGIGAWFISLHLATLTAQASSGMTEALYGMSCTGLAILSAILIVLAVLEFFG